MVFSDDIQEVNNTSHLSKPAFRRMGLDTDFLNIIGLGTDKSDTKNYLDGVLFIENFGSLPFGIGAEERYI